MVSNTKSQKNRPASWKESMSPNLLIMMLVVAGYVVVNIRMQINFFGGHDIFSKYQVASSATDAPRIAQDAYFAKTGFLLLLLILLTFDVPVGLAAGLSFLSYSAMMVIFFGFNVSTTAYAVGSVVLLGSYFVKWPPGRRHTSMSSS